MGPAFRRLCWELLDFGGVRVLEFPRWTRIAPRFAAMYGLHGQAACGCEAGASLWIEAWFGDCVYSAWELTSFYIGLSSLMFWLIAQVPQFISNWRFQSADALSPWFLFQWLAVRIFFHYSSFSLFLVYFHGFLLRMLLKNIHILL